MAHVANSRKGFNFTIFFPGFPLEPFLCQRVTIPETSVDQVEHGDANYSIKTGGRKIFGNIILEKIMTTSGPDNYFWDWMLMVQDAVVGGGLVPPAYKRTIIISELAEDGASVINEWNAQGCWPTKIKDMDLDRMKPDNTIESLEISCDLYDKV